MAYNIGQVRKTKLNQERYNFVQDFDCDIVSPSIDSQKIILEGEVSFEDTYVIIKDNGSKITLNNTNNYYLKFSIKHRKDSSQSFNVKIEKDNEIDIEDNFQIIQNYFVPKNTTSEEVWSTFEIIITPNDVYDKIVFELNRTSIDYILEDELRFAEIKILKFQKINNILEHLNLTHFSKIGVQGTNGLLMCINREEIKIGRSGIYEINNGMIINFMGFVIRDTNESFIMDYQY